MFKTIALALVAASSFAFAGDFHGRPGHPIGGISSHTSKQEITHVDREGVVKAVRQSRPYTKYLIEIPVTVAPKSACTKISGQKNEVDQQGRITEIAVMGTTLDMPCISVMPRPVEMKVKFEMTILTGGFVAANPIQKQTVNLYGKGLHQVTLNMDNKVVTVKPVGRRPR